ncbi:pyrroloquinoline quinone precursor peptide PqqA [Trinickia sp. LjRoot230]
MQWTTPAYTDLRFGFEQVRGNPPRSWGDEG